MKLEIIIGLLLFSTFSFTNLDTKEEKIAPCEERLFNIKYSDYQRDKIVDTLVNINFIEKNIFQFIQFNYQKLDFIIEENNFIQYYNDSLSLKVEAIKFDSSKYIFSYDESGSYLTKLNNRKFYGTDGCSPGYSTKISLKINNKNIAIPENIFSDLFEPNIKCINLDSGLYCYIKTYISDNNEIVLTIRQGYGAAAYIAIIILDNQGKLIKKIVEKYP